MNILTAILIGYVADRIIGDPHWMWHPICLIGNMIAAFEKLCRKIFPKTERGELAGGIFLVILVLICSSAIPLLLLGITWKFCRPMGFILACYMCYTILATKCLRTESRKVAEALTKEGLSAGRKAVSMIVGRDTESLSEEGVIKAAVETVAENTSDGVAAPLFYLAVGGPVLGYFYKAVNTMDSMVGYKNEKYLYFGRAAAKLDDVLNFLPSRICAVCMILAAPIAGLDMRGAARIWRRDRRNHASPNSAQTEAVMAGALHIQLAGDAWYFGKKYEKATIGDPIRPVEPEDIERAGRLLYAASFVALLAAVVLHLVIFRLICG